MPTVAARDVAAIGAASMAPARTLPGAGRVTRPLLLQRGKNGLTHLVDAHTGQLVSPCASPAIAQQTRNFFS